MKSIMYNSRRQEVGVLDEGIFRCSRNANLGQIFLQKHWFGNRNIKEPIAIDKSIVEQLIKAKCHTVEFTIIGLRKESFRIKINPEKILEIGMPINFDRRKEGINFTGYSVQLVFDINDSIPINQMRLIEDEK